jgi:hypothetical protein
MMSFTSFADSLDEKGAIAAAVKDAGLSMNKISRLEAEKDGGIYEIEFVRTDNGTEYDYEISAASGKILEKSVDYRYERNKSKKKIGKKAARKKASAVSGVSYKKIKKGSCKYKYKKKQGNIPSSSNQADTDMKSRSLLLQVRS